MDKKTSSLIQGYIEKAKEKLSVTESLVKLKAYDDAVSRAYYAAFHAAQAVLLTEGLSAQTHQGLVNLFGLHFVKTGKVDRKFGRYLSNLKDDRENGDYEIYSAIDQEVAEKALIEAQEFVEEMDRFLKQALEE
ncbi:MAG: HEPN domain-containing protein [Chlamydiae bacterium]|nr:HEPN domain-containing protein [Chlamydiota bacterium]MBI3265547.1 HEPN domain-containing protein [Chlamydiota bacterium]